MSAAFNAMLRFVWGGPLLLLLAFFNTPHASAAAAATAGGARIFMIQEGYTHFGAPNSKAWSASTDLLESAAGLLAQVRAGEYIYLYSPGSKNQAWAEAATTYYGATLDYTYDHADPATGLWALLNHVKPNLPKTQYIRFSYNDADARTALPICGLEQCVAVEETIAAEAESKCGLTQQESLMGRTEAQNWARFSSHPAANRNLMCENVTAENFGDPSIYRYYLNDLAVAEKAWIFWDADNGAPGTTYLDWLNDNARLVGVMSGDEAARTMETSIRGVRHIPADWSWNLATMSVFASDVPVTAFRHRPATLRDLLWEDDVSYATFIMTDGDNLQVWQGDDWHGAKRYGSPRRGQFAMGWQLPPSMGDFAPMVLQSIFDPGSPARLLENECAMTGVSGDGYFYVGAPSDAAHAFGAATGAGTSLVTTHTQMLNTWMKQNAVNIADTMPFDAAQWAGYDYANYAIALERPLGLFADTYTDSYTAGQGQLKWVADMNGIQIPVKATDYSLWDDPAHGKTDSQLATALNAIPHSGAPTTTTFVRVATHAWSWSSEPEGIMGRVHNCVSALKPFVRVVRPDIFLMQLRLRLHTAAELSQYHQRLLAETAMLEGTLSPTPEAASALATAKATLLAAGAQTGSNPVAAFAGLQQADRQVEIARLSFVALQLHGSAVQIHCPVEASPLYHFAAAELDPAALPVRRYRVQAAATSEFTTIQQDVYIAKNEIVVAPENRFVRVMAQGDSHGDWGNWSATLAIKSVNQSNRWNMFD